MNEISHSSPVKSTAIPPPRPRKPNTSRNHTGPGHRAEQLEHEELVDVDPLRRPGEHQLVLDLLGVAGRGVLAGRLGQALLRPGRPCGRGTGPAACTRRTLDLVPVDAGERLAGLGPLLHAGERVHREQQHRDDGRENDQPFHVRPRCSGSLLSQMNPISVQEQRADDQRDADGCRRPAGSRYSG